MNMERRIYIAGPMRGIPYYNFDAFLAAEDLLKTAEWNVCNPARLDLARGFDPRKIEDPNYDWSSVPEEELELTIRDIAKRDLANVLACDAIYMLSGWEQSIGATAEYAAAKFARLEIYSEEELCGDELPSGDPFDTSKTAHPVPQFSSDPESKRAYVTKDTNPKDAVGSLKCPLSVIPSNVMWQLGLALLEGAIKYGRHNYRVSGVRSSIYYDAALRHLTAWWEGEDIDQDSGLPHVIKAIGSLVVLADAMHQGMVEWDDRPPRSQPFYAAYNAQAGEIIDRMGEAKEPYTIQTSRKGN